MWLHHYFNYDFILFVVNFIELFMENNPEKSLDTKISKFFYVLEITVVLDYLSNNELLKLVSTCSYLTKMLKDRVKLRQILFFVMNSNLEKAESLLKKHPNILRYSDVCVAPSGRVFSNITAIQYAVSALDFNMFGILKKYVSKHIVKSQLTEYFSGDMVDDVLCSVYDLMYRIRLYIDFFNKRSFKVMHDFYISEIAPLYKYLPIHFLHDMYRVNQDKNFPKSYCSKEFKRYIYHSRKFRIGPNETPIDRKISVEKIWIDEPVNWHPGFVFYERSHQYIPCNILQEEYALLENLLVTGFCQQQDFLREDYSCS